MNHTTPRSGTPPNLKRLPWLTVLAPWTAKPGQGRKAP